MSSSFSNLRDQYLGVVAEEALDVAKEGTRRVFGNIFANKPAELPPPRQVPPPPPDYQPQLPPMDASSQPPPPQAQPIYYPPPPPQYGGYPPAYPQYPNYGQYASALPPAYMPPPLPMAEKIDEDSLRNMARWQASVDLKYVQAITGFVRSAVGNMAAANSMVKLVERYEDGDQTLSSEDVEMAERMRKAVDKRREIEASGNTVLEDEDMRNIYEEIIFREMKNKNDRGELQLQSSSSFRYNYLALSLLAIGETGKEVIFDKVKGVVSGAKNKFQPKKK